MEVMHEANPQGVPEVLSLLATLLFMLSGLWLIFRVKARFSLLFVLAVVSLVIGSL